MALSSISEAALPGGTARIPLTTCRESPGDRQALRVAAADGKVWLTAASDTMLYLGCEPSVVISEADALSVLDISADMANEKSYTVLVDMTTIVNLNPAARAAFNADQRVRAAALFGEGPMDRVLAAGAHNAVHPTGILHFENRCPGMAYRTCDVQQRRYRNDAWLR
ncbi:hypothetical protein IWX75_003342 [Arthrobacter sp. CAN_A6]|uniref:hypothetical protein n=1 Tax=Arthrobacter sp. CAN_A6 TaxID=2787721 RepID=UPI0018C956FB